MDGEEEKAEPEKLVGQAKTDVILHVFNLIQ